MAELAGFNSKSRGIWLVGSTLSSITGSKLPSNRQVLARFFDLHLNENLSIQDSASATTHELLQFWAKARIPTRQDYNIIVKLKDMHAKWKALKKNSSRKTATKKANEDAFSDTLDDLFDVAHADAMSLIKIEEDRKFLEAQREKGRRGCMGGIDSKLAKQEDRRLQRELLAEQRRQKEEQRKRNSSAVETVSDCDSSEGRNSDAEDSDSSATGQAGPSCVTPAKKRTRPINVITPELSSALDRTRVSDRNATYILAAAAKSLGHDPQQLVLNKESTRQARRLHRENTAREIKNSFAPDIPLTVHWDGKLLPSLTGHDTVDRLAVILSGEGIMKLLSVPQLTSGSGEAQADAVYNALLEWNVTDRVQCMSFDTTSSNTGNKSGACVLLEHKLGRSILSLACRHHIHELIIAKVFEVLLETASSGPQIRLFQRFSSAWDTINAAAYENGIDDQILAADLMTVKDEVIAFLKMQLQTYQPRDDYKELIQLALKFLGDTSISSNVHRPGAYHRARWMAKLIYCFKIYLFRSQFHLTARELSGLQQFNLFVICVYLKAWFTCSSAASAPRQDLQLLQKLVNYKRTNKTVASAALKVFMRHLWYVSETLVGLSLFDDEVDDETKISMVTALECAGADKPSKRILMEEKDSVISSKKLNEFVTSNTRQLFNALDIPQQFLQQHPSMWKSLDDYRHGQNRVMSLKVVNDAAERGISLIQSFNAVISNQEEQKQYLMQVVEKHRRDFPDPNKSTLTRDTLNS